LRRRPYRVEWAEVARRDLLSIVDYLVEKRSEAAASTLDKLERKAAALTRLPGRGHTPPELARLQVRQYRELIVPPFRLIYRLTSHRVLVLAILDSRRNLEDILLTRLLEGR